MNRRTLVCSFPDGRICSYVPLKDLFFGGGMPKLGTRESANIPAADTDDLNCSILENDEAFRHPLADRYNF